MTVLMMDKKTKEPKIQTPRRLQPLADFKPFLEVDVKTGEVLLDHRDEFCPWLASVSSINLSEV